MQKCLTFMLLHYIIIVATQKEVNKLLAKKGRPVSDNPKDYMLRVRIDEQTLLKLDECCKAENLSRSEVVRKGIQEQYDKIKK